MKRSGGFTLAEMLVACALVCVIAASAMGILVGGLRVWERLKWHGIEEQSAALAFLKIRTDVSSARPFSLLGFEGSYDSFSFPASVDFFDKEGNAYQEMGRVGYYLDSRSHSLCRSQQPFRLSAKHRLQDTCDVLLEDVQGLRVEYLVREEGASKTGWAASWKSGTLPLAVRVKLQIQPPDSDDAISRSFVTGLPVAQP